MDDISHNYRWLSNVKSSSCFARWRLCGARWIRIRAGFHGYLGIAIQKEDIVKNTGSIQTNSQLNTSERSDWKWRRHSPEWHYFKAPPVVILCCRTTLAECLEDFHEEDNSLYPAKQEELQNLSQFSLIYLFCLFNCMDIIQMNKKRGILAWYLPISHLGTITVRPMGNLKLKNWSCYKNNVS